MTRQTATMVGAFVMLALAWGATFPLTKILLPQVDPAQVVLVRVVSGFLPLLIYSLVTGAIQLKHWRFVPHFVVMSFLGTTLYYLAYAFAASEMLSGLASVLSGTAPLFVLILAALFLPAERLTRAKVLGVALGFIGVSLIANPSMTDLGQASWLGVAYVLGGAAIFGASIVYARKFLAHLAIAPAALVTYQLGIATVVLAVVVPKGGLGEALADPVVLSALVVGLGLVGTGVAFLLYYFIVQRIGAVSASSATYLPPVVGLVISVALLGETVAWTGYVAMALILTGVWLLREVPGKQT